MISYDSYRVFYYVSKCRSFTQAARQLLTSQPNITRTIRNLESALGCTLFLRSNHGVSLTPEGARLYEHVAAAVAHLQAGEEELARDKSLQTGLVTIASSEIALHCLLLPALRRFRVEYPGIHLRVQNLTAQNAVQVVKDGLADGRAGHPPPRRISGGRRLRRRSGGAAGFAASPRRAEPLSDHLSGAPDAKLLSAVILFSA